MARNMSTGCSSSFLSNQETGMNRENITPELPPSSHMQYLDSDNFPEITLLDVTGDCETHQNINDLSTLKSMPPTPMSARGLFRKFVPHNNSMKESTSTPKMKVNKAVIRPHPHLDSNVSVFWLYDECLPDITDISIDCEKTVTSPRDQSTALLTTCDNISQNANFESDMEHVILKLGEATSKKMASLKINKALNSPISLAAGATGESVPTDQDSLPSGKATCVTSDNNTIMTETSITGGHRNTIDGQSQSSSRTGMLESSCCDAYHNTLETNPPHFNSTLPLVEKNPSDSRNTCDANPFQSSYIITNTSRDGHQNTFDANPLLSNSTLPLVEKSSSDNHNSCDSNPLQSSCIITNTSSDGHHNTFDANPLHSYSTLPLVEKSYNGNHNTCNANPLQSSCIIPNTSRDGHHNTFDANPLHSNSTLPLVEKSFSDNHNTCDANPLQSSCIITNTSRDGHQNTFDANPLHSNSTLPLVEKSSSDNHNTCDANPLQSSCIITNTSSVGHQNTYDTKPSSQNNGTITMLDSSYTDNHSNTFDANPPLSGSTMTKCVSGHHSFSDAIPPSMTNGPAMVSESSSSDRHQSTFDASLPQSGSTIINSSSDGYRNILNANPPSQSNTIVNMSKSQSSECQQNTCDANPSHSGSTTTNSSSDGHHNTFNTHPPSQTNGPRTMPESSSSDCYHSTFDADLPQSGSTIINSSSDGHHNMLDANPPSQSKSTITMSESKSRECHQKANSTQSGSTITNHSSDGHHNTFDPNPPQSGSMLTNSSSGHHNMSDANTSQSGSTITNSSSGHHNIPGANPPSQTNATLKILESSSNYVHHNTLDTLPAQASDTITNSSGGGHCKILDGSPPSQSNCTKTMSESSSSDGHRSSFDANPPQVGSTISNRSSGGHQNISDACSPQLMLPVSEGGSSNNNHNTSQPNAPITRSEKNSNDHHQGTFDAKSPHLSGPMPVSESSASINHHVTFDDKPPSQPSATTSVSEKNSRDDGPNYKVSQPLQRTYEASLNKSQCATKDFSESVVEDVNIYTVFNNKVTTLNLDDTLDLRNNIQLITSTPMTNCKTFTDINRDQDKLLEAQKNLHEDASSKQAVQAPTSNMSSNITCDQEMLLPAKSMLPISKAASQLLKFKPASLLPGRGDMRGSGLPMTRQRTSAEALSARTLQKSSSVCRPYNLGATTTASEVPKFGLEKPRLTAKPSCLPKVGPLLRTRSTRSSTLTSSSVAVKIPQAKKHNLARDEPVVKKKTKMDVSTSSSHIASTPSDRQSSARSLRPSANSQPALMPKCQKKDATLSTSTAETLVAGDAASKTKSLRLPVTSRRALLTKSNGCAKCIVLEQQLKMRMIECQKLKEELQKYKKEDEI